MLSLRDVIASDPSIIERLLRIDEEPELILKPLRRTFKVCHSVVLRFPKTVFHKGCWAALVARQLCPSCAGRFLSYQFRR